MLRSNRDELLNGVVRLIRRGCLAVCRAPYGKKYRIGVKIKKDETVADSILVQELFRNSIKRNNNFVRAILLLSIF